MRRAPASSRGARPAAALCAALLLASCTGAIGEGEGASEGLDPATGVGSPGEPGAGATGTGAARPGTAGQAGATTGTAGAPAAAPSVGGGAACASGAVRGAARESVRRLTREELRATLADLLPLGTQVNGDVDQFPDLAANEDFGRFVPHHSDAQVAQWLSVADRIGGLVAADARLRAAVGADPCLASATVTAACWQGVLRTFLRRAFRRPVPDDEIARYAAPIAGKDAATGMHDLMLRVLMAPDFLFHIESGTGAVDPARARLTDHEVASRVAYALTGSMPDAALAAAADAGQVRTLAQVDAQVRRLLATPRARVQLQRFFGAWMDVSSIPAPDAQLYTAWARLPGDPRLAERDLEKDVTDFVEAVVLNEKGTFRDLMTRPASYTKSALLQAIYRSDATTVTQGMAYATPDHAGLPMRAGLLVDPGINTHPITRGVRFLKRILCEDLPSPDPTIIAMRDDVKVDPLTMPNHQRVAAMTGAPACQPCHSKINPIGFVLEAYDPVARTRTQESYLESSKGMLKVSATHALPGSVDLGGLPGLPARLGSPRELAETVGRSEQARACVGVFLVRQLQRRKETAHDECALKEVAHVLSGDQPVLEAFVRSVVNEDIFWRGL